MWWFLGYFNTWLVNICIKILKCGTIPKHMAFILDGNRRFAKKLHREAGYGHSEGSKVVKTVAEWCDIIGVQELTFYAFSIENFKRSKEEVEHIFKLIERAVLEIVNTRKNARVRLVGNLNALPEDLKKSLAKCSLQNWENANLNINLAIAYTSRDEITNAINVVRKGVRDGSLQIEDIDEELLNQCMYVSSKPDLMIRTSGESRFSDFLLWQMKHTIVFFIEIMWPEITIWHLLTVVMKYQFNAKFQSFLENGVIGKLDIFEKIDYLVTKDPTVEPPTVVYNGHLQTTRVNTEEAAPLDVDTRNS
ncbi:hypothetical protein FQA39_LY16791 [Lamprigera yunnana]|nr:hypothetical protein FQA39_LY16791 [Lamprigera yunnana]